ncbi:hypothetical protein B0O99DRAFT_527010 [Bisporella sp. PMI_857]|nr:hypothetical protein B0O99DRAFT_527010 [Bisporella sp. PMI_857]
MDPPTNYPTLRKIKPFYNERNENAPSLPSARIGVSKVRKLLRVEFKDPKDDYRFVQELKSGQGVLSCHQRNPLHLAVIRQSFSQAPLHMLEVIAKLQHPNIANTVNAYFYDNKLSIVGEYVDISLLELAFNTLSPEEWEIATIIAEVCKAMVYLLDVLPVCEIHIDSVRVSLQGHVKLGKPRKS